MLAKIALISAVLLPFFNIPLIVKMIKRKSSTDLSLFWAFGVWVCLIGMFPQSLRSTEIIWKIFTILNLVFFSVVVFCVVIFHRGNRNREKE